MGGKHSRILGRPGKTATGGKLVAIWIAINSAVAAAARTQSPPAPFFLSCRRRRTNGRGAASGCEACIEKPSAPSVVMPVMPFASRLGILCGPDADAVFPSLT